MGKQLIANLLYILLPVLVVNSMSGVWIFGSSSSNSNSNNVCKNLTFADCIDAVVWRSKSDPEKRMTPFTSYTWNDGTVLS